MPLRCKRDLLLMHSSKAVRKVSSGIVLALAVLALSSHVAESKEPPVPGDEGTEHQRGAWALKSGADGANVQGPQGEFRRQFRRRRFGGQEPGAEGLPNKNPEGQERRQFRRNFDGSGNGPGDAAGRSGGGQFGGASPRQAVGAGGLGGGLGGGRRFMGAPINLQKLGLSEDQKQKIRAMRSKNSDRARDLRQVLKEKRTSMRDLMFDPNASEAQIRAMRRELRKMQDQMEDLQIDDFLSMRSILTPEQRKRLPEIMPGAPQGGGPSGGLPGGPAGGPPQGPPPESDK